VVTWRPRFQDKNVDECQKSDHGSVVFTLDEQVRTTAGIAYGNKAPHYSVKDRCQGVWCLETRQRSHHHGQLGDKVLTFARNVLQGGRALHSWPWMSAQHQYWCGGGRGFGLLSDFGDQEKRDVCV
jgi:hypothetical protein